MEEKRAVQPYDPNRRLDAARFVVDDDEEGRRSRDRSMDSCDACCQILGACFVLVRYGVPYVARALIGKQHEE